MRTAFRHTLVTACIVWGGLAGFTSAAPAEPLTRAPAVSTPVPQSAPVAP